MSGTPAASVDGGWTLVLTPRRSGASLAEVWGARDLLWLFVRRDFVTAYKQTILGPLWLVLGPLLNTVLFAFVFHRVAGIPTDGAPALLFYLAGIVLWTLFSSTLVSTSSALLAYAPIMGKVYFPRLIVPLSITVSALLRLSVHLAVLFVCALYYWLSGAVAASPAVLSAPLWIAIAATQAMALGIVVAAATVRYRDLQNLVQFGVQLWMYATPVIYPLSIVPDRLRGLFLANPMASLVEAFRYGFTGTGGVHPGGIVYAVVFTAATLSLGVLLFRRIEATVTDSL